MNGNSKIIFIHIFIPYNKNDIDKRKNNKIKKS